MMKKYIMFTALVISIFLMNGCTKSENDKIVGVWKLTNYEKTYNDVEIEEDGITVTDVTTYIFNGTIITNTYSDGDVTTHSYSEILTINEDGTYKLETVTDGKAEIEEDYWYWYDSYKEKAVFGLNEYWLYTIKELSKDKLIFEINNEQQWSESGYSYNEKVFLSKTYVKQ